MPNAMKLPEVTPQGTQGPGPPRPAIPENELVARGKALLRQYALADLHTTLLNFAGSATPPDCTTRRERLADLLRQIRMTVGK